MEKRDYEIAVIDLGKTNKKISILSREFDFLFTESTQIGVIENDGIMCDDIVQTNARILRKLKELTKKHKIKVISVTTFGATVAHIDNKGDLVFPIISYTHEPGEEIRKKFYDYFGSREELYLKTATPPYGELLNVAMQLFWLKEKEIEKWNNIAQTLFLPQYEGYFFTGEKAVEYTSVGCHTYLYDFEKKGWSDVAKKIGMKMQKEISYPWDILGRLKGEICTQTGLDNNCKVTVGIHDSNSSLLAYLLGGRRNFLLASTGTWCVFMYPGADFYLSVDDLYKDALYYIGPFSKPVRASRFKGGEEHDYYSNKISDHFGKDPKKIQLDIDILKKILDSNNCFVIPTLTPGSGQFPNSKPRIIGEKVFYRDIQTAYHVLCLSVAIQSYFAIKQIVDEKRDITIFVEGGFRNNNIFLGILSSLFQKQKIVATSVKEATSLGAGICGKCAYESIRPDEIDPRLVKISEKAIEKLRIDTNLFKKYIDKFKEFC